MIRRLVPLAAAFSLAIAAPAQETQPQRARLPADWGARDFEGRWYVYAGAMESDPSTHMAWVRALSDLRDYEMLEWIALTFPGFGAGKALADLEAPNWLRCAAWYARNAAANPLNDSHGMKAAKAAYATGKKGVAAAWLKLHPEAGPLGSEVAATTPTMPDEVEAMAQRPPLLPENVFVALTAAARSGPDGVVEFGSRITAAPGQLYVHQVARALAALSLASRLQAEWAPTVLGLTRHAHPSVRSEALLSTTMMNPALLPLANLIVTGRDARERFDVRQATVMAFSRSAKSPIAWAELHRIASDPAHPAFKVAVSRLGDLGDGFSLRRLAALPASLPPAERALVKQASDRIDERVLAESFQKLLDESQTQERLARGAWLVLTNDPLATDYVAWMNEVLTPRHDRGLTYNRELLDRMRKSFVAPADFDFTALEPSGAPSSIPGQQLIDAARTLAANAIAAAETRPK